MEQIFLKPDGIKGASTSKNGKDEIEILSYSYGMSMPVTHSVSEGQRTHGQANVSDLSISKYVDATTPIFLQHCARGTNIPKMKLRQLRADEASGTALELLTIDMENALVTSISCSGSDQPVESITFNFSKITWTYHQQKSDVSDAGQVPATYDIAANKVS